MGSGILTDRFFVVSSLLRKERGAKEEERDEETGIIERGNRKCLFVPLVLPCFIGREAHSFEIIKRCRFENKGD